MRNRLYPLGVVAVLLSAVVAGGPGSAVGGSYPDRPIKAILPYSPGSGADVVARLAMDKLSAILKQNVIIENRPGSAGIAGTLAAAKSPPDGYTLAIIATQQSITPSLYKSMPYDIVRDFVPVARLTQHPVVLAVPASLPVNSVQELVDYIKKRPGELNYGSTGVGTSLHLAGAYFASVAGLKVTHIPYTSTAAALVGLTRGDVTFMFYGHEALGGVVQSGQVKMLASTGDTRPTWAANMPTIKESGYPTYSLYSWHAVLAPAGTPKTIVDILDQGIATAMNDPVVKQKYEAVGATPNYLGSQDFEKFFRSELSRYREIVKLSGIQPN